MKTLMFVCVILLVVGCGKDKQSGNTTANPVKQLTAEEKKVVGEYGYRGHILGDKETGIIWRN